MRILIAGGGIAGLGAVLALSGEDHQIEVVDRDAAPPSGDFNDIFDQWERRGATQLRQSHAFHSGIVKLIRTRHPELRTRFRDAGVREVTFEDMVPPELKPSYRPDPVDANWGALMSRRSTLEAVMRTYAEECTAATFHSGYVVRGLITEPGPCGIPAVTGLKVEGPDSAMQVWNADIIIDASGRNTSFPQWLSAIGVNPDEEEAPAGIVYHTRNYRFLPGQTPPTNSNRPMGGDYGFIKGALFPADNSNFSITLSLPEIETKMRQAILRPEVFDEFARNIPGFDAWIEPLRTVAVSKVYGMGDLKSVWRHWSKNGRPLLLNFFAIGDASIRSNPLYGRGCSLATVQAQLLADVLHQSNDPVERANLFEKSAFKKIRPFYDAMVRQDQSAIQRARDAQDPNHKPSFRDKLMKSFAEDAIAPSITGNIKVFRAFMQSAHMLDSPTGWMRKRGVLTSILSTWATPRALKKKSPMAAVPLDRAKFLRIAEQRGE